MGLRIRPSMPSTKEQRRRRDEQRNGSRNCSQEWEKDPLGCLPTQMTSQSFHWVKHPRVLWLPGLVVKEILCLSIKGAVCEDDNDLENKQRKRWHSRGTGQKKLCQTEKQTHSDRDLTRSTCSTQKCVTESSVRRKHRSRHTYWNRLNLIKLKECSSEGETNNTELFCKCAINHEEAPSLAPTANCSVLILDHR